MTKQTESESNLMQAFSPKLIDNVIDSLGDAIRLTKHRIPPTHFVLAIGTAAHAIATKPASGKAQKILNNLVHAQLESNKETANILGELTSVPKPVKAEILPAAMAWLTGVSAIGPEVKTSLIAAIAFQLIERSPDVSMNEIRSVGDALLNQLSAEYEISK